MKRPAALSLALALTPWCCTATTNAAAPQRVVQRAEANQFWSGAADAPVYLSTTPADHINVWDARDGTLVRTIALPRASTPWAFADSPTAVVSRDGRIAAVRIGEDRIAIVRTADGNLMPLATKRTGALFPLAFSPDGTDLAIEVRPPESQTGQSQQNEIEIIAVASGRALQTIAGTSAAAFSSDGRKLATISVAHDRLLVVDRTGTRIRTLRDGGGIYGPIIFSPDDATIATGGDDPAIPPRGDGTFDPSSTGHDLVVKLWDLKRGRLRTRFPGLPTSQLNSLDEGAPGAFAFADASTLAVCTAGATTLYGTTSTNAVAHDDFRNVGQRVFRVGGALGFVVNHAASLSFDRQSGPKNVTYASVPYAP